MLRLRNLNVFYGRVQAVRRASLHVGKGEIVALIGANGAGKTTLLTAVSGLMRADSGSIEFDSVDISKVSPDGIVKQGLSHVPEGRLVFGPMSVEDNLLLGAFTRRKKSQRSAVERDRDKMFEMFPRLKERRGQAAGTLSGGEQQMVAIARALMARPRMLLLDEPGMGLAPTVTRDIFTHVQELRDSLGLTVLLVEQNARAALKIADRGYVLETGRIILQGPAKELLANNDVQRAYLGRDLDREVQPDVRG